MASAAAPYDSYWIADRLDDFHPVEDFTKAGSQVFAGNWVHAQLLAVYPRLKMDVICA